MTRFPPVCTARTIASRTTRSMAIDLVVLLAIVLAVQTGGNRVIDNVYKEETDQLDLLSDQIDDAEEVRDNAEDRVDEADDRIERARNNNDDVALEEAQAEKQVAEDEADAADREVDRLDDDAQDVQGKLVPAQLMLTGAILVLALLYLV